MSVGWNKNIIPMRETIIALLRSKLLSGFIACLINFRIKISIEKNVIKSIGRIINKNNLNSEFDGAKNLTS